MRLSMNLIGVAARRCQLALPHRLPGRTGVLMPSLPVWESQAGSPSPSSSPAEKSSEHHRCEERYLRGTLLLHIQCQAEEFALWIE